MHFPTEFRTLQLVCLCVGIPALAVSCYMTWKFGASVSHAHGIGLALSTVFAAIIFALRAHVINALQNLGVETKWPGRGLATLGVFFVFFEFVGDLGYTFGMRDKQIVEAGAQTVVYREVHDNLASEKGNVEMWRKQLGDLTAQNAWVTSVSADGLRAKLASANLAIEQEAARGGCKQRCLDRTKERDDLADRIKMAEKADDLSKRIEATQRIIDEKVGKATATKVGHSTAVAQNKAFARVGLLLSGSDATEALTPGETAQTWADYIIGLLMAIAATILPPVAFYFAFWSPPQRHRTVTPTPVGEQSGNRTPDEPRAYPAMNLTRVTVGDLNRERLRRILDGNAIPA